MKRNQQARFLLRHGEHAEFIALGAAGGIGGGVARVDRLLTFQELRHLGIDTTPYAAPFEGTVRFWWESVDSGDRALLAMLRGELLTIDKSISEEYQGDYELLKMSVPQIIAGEEGARLEIECLLKQYVAAAYTDVAGATQIQNPTTSLQPPIDPQIHSTQAIIHVGRNANNATEQSYHTISLTSYVVADGDQLEFDVFIDPDSPAFKYSLDFQFTPADGSGFTTFHQLALKDQNNIGSHPNNDLAGFANGRFYHRVFDISSLAGKTINAWMSAFDMPSAAGGVARGRLANIKITRGGGLVRAIFVLNLLGFAPVFGGLEVNFTDVRLYTAEAGVLPPAGKNLLPNPGFEANASQTPVNGNLRMEVGQPLTDGWAIGDIGAPGNFNCQILDNNVPRTGRRCLYLSLATGVSIPNGTLTYVRAFSDPFPVMQDDIYVIGGYIDWTRDTLFPAGVSGQANVALYFYDITNAFISQIFVNAVVNPFVYVRAQVQAAVPANAAYARFVCTSAVTNSSGGTFSTGTGFYWDIRFDDLFLINKTRSFDVAPVDGADSGAAPGVLTQSGATTTILMAAWTDPRGFGNVIYNSGSVNAGGVNPQLIYVFLDDPTMSGGSVSPQATLDPRILNSAEGRIYVDKINLLVGGGGSGGGGGGGGHCVADQVPIRLADESNEFSDVIGQAWLKDQAAFPDRWRWWKSCYDGMPNELIGVEIVEGVDLFDIWIVGEDRPRKRCAWGHAVLISGSWQHVGEISQATFRKRSRRDTEELSEDLYTPFGRPVVWVEESWPGKRADIRYTGVVGRVWKFIMREHFPYLAGGPKGVWAHNPPK